MDNLVDFHAFWSCSVPPNSTKTVTIPKGVVAALSNASLSVKEDSPLNGGRTTLYCQVNGQPEIALFPFALGRFESTNADMVFFEENVVKFRTKGDFAVDLCGTLSGGFSVKIE